MEDIQDEIKERIINILEEHEEIIDCNVLAIYAKSFESIAEEIISVFRNPIEEEGE